MNNINIHEGNNSAIGSGRGIYFFSLFILNIGMARSMGPAGFGSFQQIFIFSAFFTIFSLGIPETIYLFFPRLDVEEIPAFIGQTLLMLAAAGIMSGVLFWFTAPIIAGKLGNPSIVTELRVFGVYGTFLIVSTFADPIYIIFKNLKYLFILSAFHGLFFIVLTIWQYFTKCSLMTIFVSMSIFGLCKFLLALWFLKTIKLSVVKILFLRSRYSILLRLMYAFPVALTLASDVIFLWLDKFVILFFLGTESLGIFAAGTGDIPLISVFAVSLYSVIFPKLNSFRVNNNMDEFAKVITKLIKFSSKIIWPLCLYLFVFADHLIPLVYTEAFSGAVEPFRVYMILWPLKIIMLGVILTALGQQRVLLRVYFGSLVLNVFLTVFLVQRIGFLGPAIATAVSTCIQVMILMWLVLANLKVRLSELIPFDTLFYVALTSGLAGSISYILTRSYRNDLIAVLMSLTIFVGAYIFIGSKLKMFRIISIMDLLGGDFFGKED
ncbi:oligosaccharide flippase family protein [Candidatus Latescibacterota bacterium]